MSVSKSETNIPCAWCGGTGFVKGRRKRSFVHQTLWYLLLYGVGLALLYLVVQFFVGGIVGIIAVVVTFLIGIGLESGALPTAALLYFNRARDMPCKHCHKGECIARYNNSQ